MVKYGEVGISFSSRRGGAHEKKPTARIKQAEYRVVVRARRAERGPDRPESAIRHHSAQRKPLVRLALPCRLVGTSAARSRHNHPHAVCERSPQTPYQKQKSRIYSGPGRGLGFYFQTQAGSRHSSGLLGDDLLYPRRILPSSSTNLSPSHNQHNRWGWKSPSPSLPAPKSGTCSTVGQTVVDTWGN